MLLISGTITLISWSLAKHIIKPIDKLINVISEVNDPVLPSGFSKEFKQDEIGLFAHKLDLAMQRISQFVQREQHFTRDVSHELRTPIAISNGAITLLTKTPLTTEQLTLVSRLDDAQNQMQLCISALLTLAREDDFNNESFALLPIIEECIIEHHKLIDNKRIELKINVPHKAKLVSNKLAVKMIIGNCLSNAFQHTQQGTIEIIFSENILKIKDSGRGIAPEIIKDVYTSGVKGHKSVGFGIGLSLVKRLCEKIHIAINLSSTKAGTTISLKW